MRAVEHLLRATARAEARHFWFRGFRAFVTPFLRYATAGRSNPRLVDCGCGTGTNLALLGRFGRAYGFDLSPTGVAIGRGAGRRRLARASVTAVPFASASFDVAASFDVLYSLEDADERIALDEMYRILKPGGFAIINVDAVVIAERPKLVPYIDQIRRKLSSALGIDPSHISVKGKTNEGMGWIGREEGIACVAVATLLARDAALPR